MKLKKLIALTFLGLFILSSCNRNVCPTFGHTTYSGKQQQIIEMPEKEDRTYQVKQ